MAIKSSAGRAARGNEKSPRLKTIKSVALYNLFEAQNYFISSKNYLILVRANRGWIK